TLKELKESIDVYPNNNRLKSYSNEYLRALLPEQKVEQHYNSASRDNLIYMNLTHSDELLRCYHPGDPGKEGTAGTIIATVTGDYKIISDYLDKTGNSHSAVNILMAHLKYVRTMLDAFGEKEASTLLRDQPQLLLAIESAQYIERLLNAYIGKTYSEMK